MALQIGFLMSVLAFPSTNNEHFARVKATFNRLVSFKNPMPRVSPVRTQENMITSRSWPWNPSYCGNSKHHHHSSQVYNSADFNSLQGILAEAMTYFPAKCPPLVLVRGHNSNLPRHLSMP